MRLFIDAVNFPLVRDEVRAGGAGLGKAAKGLRARARSFFST